MDKILGKEEAEVLMEVRGKISHLSVIAGGAVRDKVHDMPYRDVDIFIPVHDSPIFPRFGWGYLIDELLPDMFAGADISVKKDPYDGFPDGALMIHGNEKHAMFKVIDVYMKPTKYQLIFMPKIDKLFASFDLNCNLVSFDGTATNTRNAKFREFFQTKRVVSTKPLTHMIVSRVHHLQKKYPNWTVAENIMEALKKKDEKVITTTTTTSGKKTMKYTFDWAQMHQQAQANMGANLGNAQQANFNIPVDIFQQMAPPPAPNEPVGMPDDWLQWNVEPNGENP